MLLTLNQGVEGSSPSRSTKIKRLANSGAFCFAYDRWGSNPKRAASVKERIVDAFQRAGPKPCAWARTADFAHEKKAKAAKPLTVVITFLCLLQYASIAHKVQFHFKHPHYSQAAGPVSYIIGTVCHSMQYSSRLKRFRIVMYCDKFDIVSRIIFI